MRACITLRDKQKYVKTTNNTIKAKHLIVGEKIIQLEGCANAASYLRSPLSCGQRILFRQSAR